MLRGRSLTLLSRRAIVALTAIAFAVLVSVAATHLHLGADADEGCAVCAAVAGKLAGPQAAPDAKLGAGIATWLAVLPSGRSAPRLSSVVLPPSRAPPAIS